MLNIINKIKGGLLLLILSYKRKKMLHVRPLKLKQSHIMSPPPRDLSRVLSVIENNFPQVNGSLSSVHTPLAGSISLLNYLQNWPGKSN